MSTTNMSSGINPHEKISDEAELLVEATAFTRYTDNLDYDEDGDGRQTNIHETAIAEDDEDVNDLEEDEMWFREELAKHQTIHWSKRPSILSVNIILFLFTFSISVGSAPTLVVVFQLCCNTVSKHGLCDPVEAQLYLATVTQYLTVAGGILPLLVSAKFGEMSDRFGRRPMINLIIGGLLLHKLINYYLFSTSTVFPFTSFVAFQFLFSAVGGVGSLTAISQSYVSDVASSTKRTQAIAYNAAALSIGQAVGPLFSNFLSSLVKIDTAQLVRDDISTNNVGATATISRKQLLPMQFEIGILAVLAFYSIFILPESRGEKALNKSRASSVITVDATAMNHLRALEQPTIWTKINRYLNLFKPLLLLTYPSSIVPAHKKHMETKYRSIVISLIIVLTLYASTFVSIGGVLMQYGMLKFNWGSDEIGYFITLLSVSSTLALVILTPFLSNTMLQNWCQFKVLKQQFDLVDFWLLIYGRIVVTISSVGLVFATNSGQFYLAIIVLTLSGPADAAASAALLKFFPNSKTGEFFGALHMLDSFCNLIFPFIVMALFKIVMQKGVPQLIFLVVVIVSVIYLGVIIFIKKTLHLTRDSIEEELSRSNSTVSFTT